MRGERQNFGVIHLKETTRFVSHMATRRIWGLVTACGMGATAAGAAVVQHTDVGDRVVAKALEIYDEKTNKIVINLKAKHKLPPLRLDPPNSLWPNKRLEDSLREALLTSTVGVHVLCAARRCRNRKPARQCGIRGRPARGRVDSGLDGKCGAAATASLARRGRAAWRATMSGDSLDVRNGRGERAQPGRTAPAGPQLCAPSLGPA